MNCSVKVDFFILKARQFDWFCAEIV